MAYKGKPVKIKQVSEELGVRYLLEGSVLKEGDLIRVTAQLVDAIKGHHLWAEKYDRDIKGFFKILDEITKKIRTALQVQLTYGDFAPRQTLHRRIAIYKHEWRSRTGIFLRWDDRKFDYRPV